MARITGTDETELRSAIAADLATLPLAGNIFNRRRAFNSRNDFFQRLGIVVNHKTEIRFTEIELLNVEDSPDEGPDDCPVATLTYGFHSFHEFADIRSDDTNSDADFTANLIAIRDKFLSRQTYVLSNWKVEIEPVVPAEFTQFGNDSFTDVLGHSKNLNLKAYFYDK